MWKWEVLVFISTLGSYSILQPLENTGRSWFYDYLRPHHQKPSRLSSTCSKREWNIETCSFASCWGRHEIRVRFLGRGIFAVSSRPKLVRCPCAFRLRRLAQNVGTDLSLPKVSFYQRTVLVFSVMSISCGRRWTSGTLWNLKRRFAWQMQDMYNCIGMYRAFCHPRGRRSNVAKTWANVCQNERCFWRSLCVALAIFGLRSERVGNVVLWNWCHC